MRCGFVLAVTVAAALSGRITPLASAQEGGHEATHHAAHAEQSDEAVVLTLDQTVANAVVRGDTAYVDSVTVGDFVMVHGDGWTRGGTPTLVDDKNSFMKRIAGHTYAAHDFDSVRAEMHGDVAITYGRYLGNIPSSGEGRAWFAVWYEKIYQKRDGRWIYLSHRTVHGAAYGLDRQSVSEQ
jgi:uncharacterized protein DUF4440